MSIINIAKSDNNIILSDPVEEFFTAKLTSTFDFGSLSQSSAHQIPVDNSINGPTDPVQILSSGEIIFNETGLFVLEKYYLIGRDNSINEAYAYIYDEVNGLIQAYGDSIFKLNEGPYYERLGDSVNVSVQTVPFTYKFFIWSDSQGEPDGKLLSSTPVYLPSPTSSFQVTVKRKYRYKQ
jgi:hypothetical protein